MQKDNDSSNRRIPTSAEVVDVPPPFAADNEATALKSNNIYNGTTELTKDDLHHLFQSRNLAFVVKRWFTTCHPSLGRDSRRFDFDKHF